MPQNINRVTLNAIEETVIAALAKYAANANIVSGTTSMSSTELQAELQAHVDAANAAKDARASLSRLVALSRARRAATAPLLPAIRNYAAAAFGEQSPEFAAFGFKPKKAAQRTAESKAGAVEKLRATRAARHTMGKRQRSAIHGVLATSLPPSGPVALPPATAAPPATPSVLAAPSNGASTNGATPNAGVNGVSH